MSNTTLLPFQPDVMSPDHLAAVSYLARYSDRTHTLYAFQLRRWFEWCEANGLDPLVDKPATMPITVPVLRMLEACRGQRTEGRLVLRPLSGKPIDRRDAYRMVARVARVAGIPHHISPRSLRHAAITNAVDAGVPSETPRSSPDTPTQEPPSTTTVPAETSTDGVHFLTAYVAGV